MAPESLRSSWNRHFRHTGYLRVPGKLPVNLVDRMRHVVHAELAAARPPLRTAPDGRPIRIDRVVDRDACFLEAVRHPVARDALTAILGPNIVLLRNRHNHATLNRRGDIPYRFHRDIVQWSRPIVTLLIYLDEATVDTGCTHIVPGSHFEPFAGMPPDGGGGNWTDHHEEYAHFDDQALPVPMPSGGMLLIDSLMFHSVGRNTTDRDRTSVTLALRSVDELSRDDAIHHEIIIGAPVYKGNDLDYNQTVPALNNAQADARGAEG